MSYEFRPIAQSAMEQERLIDLFSAVWPGSTKLSAEYIDWQYWKNTYGHVVGINAWSGENVVGHYAMIPCRFSVGGSIANGLLSLNTAVHPDHQGRGLFSDLASATYELANQLGFEFVVGVANQNSVHGFTKKLGFRHLGQLDARVCTTLPKNIAAVAPSENVSVSYWTDSQYEWRLANPSSKYFIRMSDDKRCCFVFSDTRKAGLPILARVEFDAALISYLEARLTKHGPAPYLWFGRQHPPIEFGYLSLRVPDRFRKPPLHLIHKALSGATKRMDGPISIDALDFDLV